MLGFSSWLLSGQRIVFLCFCSLVFVFFFLLDQNRRFKQYDRFLAGSFGGLVGKARDRLVISIEAP